MLNSHKTMLCSLTLVLGVAAGARGTIITFTGGDAGGGIALNHPIVAIHADFYQNGSPPTGPILSPNTGFFPDVTLQGVTFTSTSLSPNVSVAFTPGDQFNTYAANYAPPTGGGHPDANDTALTTLLNNADYEWQAVQPMTFTISGLTAGLGYRVEYLTSTINAIPIGTQTFTYNGESGPRDTLHETANSSLAYNIQENVVAMSNHTITLTVGGPGERFSALVVTPLPEPASWVLIGLATVGLLFAARRRRRLA